METTEKNILLEIVSIKNTYLVEKNQEYSFGYRLNCSLDCAILLNEIYTELNNITNNTANTSIN